MVKKNQVMLIDTNVFVDHLRNFSPASHFFEELDDEDEILFSAITESELLAGSANNIPEKREKLLQFLNKYFKIPVDNSCAALAGDISRKYGVEIPDAIIAATALLNNAKLVTKNVKDFIRVRDISVITPY